MRRKFDNPLKFDKLSLEPFSPKEPSVLSKKKKNDLAKEYNQLNAQIGEGRFEEITAIFNELPAEEMIMAKDIIYNTGNNLEVVFIRTEGLALLEKLEITPDEFRAYMRMGVIIVLAQQNP